MSNLTLRRFYRPEDVSRDQAYRAASFHEVYASEEQVTVGVEDVVGRCTVVPEGRPAGEGGANGGAAEACCIIGTGGEGVSRRRAGCLWYACDAGGLAGWGQLWWIACAMGLLHHIRSTCQGGAVRG